ARRNLIARGVPAENIEIIKPAQSGTFYEAKVLAEKVGEENLNTVLIVTSAYHTRRAFWIVSKIFADENVKTEIGIVSPPAGIQTPAPLLWWLKSKGWGTVAGEYVKTFGYWMFY
ncbi:MAG: YdcF family protein, partial [Pyrinomonadaceae bacterium]